jgi:hypothetical protein
LEIVTITVRGVVQATNVGSLDDEAAALQEELNLGEVRARLVQLIPSSHSRGLLADFQDRSVGPEGVDERL